MICWEGLSLPRGFTNRRFSWVRSGRFSKTQMMRTSVFNCASLNKDAQIIHHGHGSLDTGRDKGRDKGTRDKGTRDKGTRDKGRD